MTHGPPEWFSALAPAIVAFDPAAAVAETPWWRRALAFVRAAHRRRRERRELLALDDRTLADIGLTRCDALREAEKPFWQP